MQEAYVELNGVRTKITTYGKWIEETVKENEDIVVIIPGNPGVNTFYNLFAKTIHEKLGYPVWCVGHAGHNNPANAIAPLPPLEENKQRYGLKGQVDHKAEFFEKYVPKHAKVHLIGHSIGSYMILEILEHASVKDKVSDVYLLFPTVEHMETTSNGKFLTGVVKQMVWLIVFLSWIFTILPTLVQTILLNIYMTITGITPKKLHLKSIKEVIDPNILKKVFFLAYEEMDIVLERNNDVIKRNIDKIKFVYGETDGWAPRAYYDRIKSDIPKVDAEICRINHAFVLRQSVTVGNMVTDWITTKNVPSALAKL